MVSCGKHWFVLEEIFKPTSTCYSGYGVGIFGALDQRWSDMCCMMTQDPAEATTSTTTSLGTDTLCSKLSMCVCHGHGEESFHCHHQLKTLIKSFLKVVPVPKAKAKQKNQPSHPLPAAKAKAKALPTKPAARLKAESAFLILRLRVMDIEKDRSQPMFVHQDQPESQPKSQMREQWGGAVQRAAAKVSKDLHHLSEPDELFIHIGYMNFSSWHFTGLELERRGEPRQDGGLDLAVSEEPRFWSSLKFVHDRVNLSKQWVLAFFEVRSTSERVSPANMIPGALVVDQLEDLPEVRFWRGSLEEAISRAARAKPKRKKSSDTAAKPARSKLKLPKSIMDAYDEHELIEDILAVDSGAESNGDQAFNDASSSDEEEKDSVPDMTQRKQDLKRRWPFWGKKPVKDKGKSSSSVPVTPVPPPPAPPPSHPPPASPVGVVKRAVASRVRGKNEVKMNLPLVGELHFYPSSSTMAAFCPVHENDCRRSRTTKAAAQVRARYGEGQGRPIGALVAWLRDAENHATREEHVKCCYPTKQQRIDARTWFSKLPDASSFSTHEREKRDGENSEPEEIV